MISDSGSSYDVVVVGGGVIGGSIAYLLAKAGLRVCIMEREAIGSGASGHGHGAMCLVGNDFKRGPHFDLGLESSGLYADFAGALLEDSGIDTLYHELPSISLALTDEEEEIFRAVMTWQSEQIPLRWIDIDECRSIEPRISDRGLGGVLNHHGQVDGYRVSLAAVTAVERLGGILLLREATGLQYHGDRVTGVTYAGGAIAAERVVLCGGAWIGAARTWIDYPIPVRPLHGEVLNVRLPGDPLAAFILTGRHGPLLQRKDGIIMAGSIGGVTMSGMDVHALHVFDPADTGPWEFDMSPHESGRNHMLECTLRIMPAMEDATLVAHLAGVRPLSADRLPIIGPVPGREGVYLATGHGTKGIHLAAVTAKIVRDALLTGRHSSDYDAFLPSRFDALSTRAER
ncbi:MAG: NAD(P)/FAD-dependent oxidoreductase [Candidatus Dormibacteria bacterium]